MRLELRAPPPAGIEIRIEPARPRPLDWDRWRDAALAGTPLEPIAESCTVPEGWPVTIHNASIAWPDVLDEYDLDSNPLTLAGLNESTRGL